MKNILLLFIYNCNLFFYSESYASILDIFKDPLELCMERVMEIEGDYEAAYAAKVCSGSNKSTKKCMDKILAIEGKYEVAFAARRCNGN